MIAISWGASLVAVALATIADVQVWSGATLFGILGPLVIVAVTAALTWSNTRNNRWHDNFDSEKAAHDLTKEDVEKWRLEAEAQRDLKHSALNELAAERLKHDFTGVLKAIQSFQQDHQALRDAFNQRTELFQALMQGQTDLQEGQQAIVRALEGLVDKLNVKEGH